MNRNRLLMSVSASVLGIGFVLGALAFPTGSVPVEPIRGLGPDHGLGEHVRFLPIASNNLVVTGILLLGAVSLGIPTLLNLFVNGLLFGFAIRSMVENGYVVEIAYVIAPHGLLELLAYCVAGAVGFRVPYELVRYLRGERNDILSRAETRSLAALAVFALALTVAASWVEAEVTWRLIEILG